MNLVLRTRPTITRAADAPIVIEWVEIKLDIGITFEATSEEFGVTVRSLRDPIHKCMREIARTSARFHHQRPVRLFMGTPIA